MNFVISFVHNLLRKNLSVEEIIYYNVEKSLLREFSSCIILEAKRFT